MDRRNVAITNKMTEVLNNVKGFEAAISNPSKGKMLVRHNGVSFYVTVEPVFNDNERGKEADSRTFEEIVESVSWQSRGKHDEKDMDKLRMWWIPIPHAGSTKDSFYIPVRSVEEGEKVMYMLDAYDKYLMQNELLFTYNSCWGLQRWNEDSKDWEDWDMTTECERTGDLEAFTHALFTQIDVEKIDRLMNR